MRRFTTASLRKDEDNKTRFFLHPDEVNRYN